MYHILQLLIFDFLHCITINKFLTAYKAQLNSIQLSLIPIKLGLSL